MEHTLYIGFVTEAQCFENREMKMTRQEQDLADDKMRAEIARLLAEARQIGVSTFLAPFLAAAGLMGATAALVKIFFV